MIFGKVWVTYVFCKIKTVKKNFLSFSISESQFWATNKKYVANHNILCENNYPKFKFFQKNVIFIRAKIIKVIKAIRDFVDSSKSAQYFF